MSAVASLLEVTTAPAELPLPRLAEVLAILVTTVTEALSDRDRSRTLESIANRLDAYGRTPGGSESAQMLGAISGALMRLEA